MSTETPVIRPLRVFAMATTAVALFSIMNVFVKLAAENHSVIEIMFFRNALAIVPVMMLILLHPLQFQLFKTKNLKGHLLRGVVGMGSMTCFFWSFVLLPLADATAIQFAMPIILTALSVPILKEKVGPWRWGAVVVGFIGILIIAAPSGDTNLFGSLVAFGAACCTATTMMIVRTLGRTEHALTIVFYFSVIGTVISAAFLPFYWEPPTLLSFTYLILCGLTGGAGQVFLTKAYAEAPAAYVSPFNYTSIIFATFFGWAIWGDVPAMHVLVGAGIVIASGLFILYRETVVKRGLVKDAMLDPAPTQADEREAGQPEPAVYNPPSSEGEQKQ
ncbi:MAG: DMT family transporter [Alphaproteobacteria bacterium]|nr:DMT family transporter [Alphaproteobacteria bacterium]